MCGWLSAAKKINHVSDIIKNTVVHRILRKEVLEPEAAALYEILIKHGITTPPERGFGRL